MLGYESQKHTHPNQESFKIYYKISMGHIEMKKSADKTRQDLFWYPSHTHLDHSTYDLVGKTQSMIMPSNFWMQCILAMVFLRKLAWKSIIVRNILGIQVTRPHHIWKVNLSGAMFFGKWKERAYVWLCDSAGFVVPCTLFCTSLQGGISMTRYGRLKASPFPFSLSS